MCSKFFYASNRNLKWLKREWIWKQNYSELMIQELHLKTSAGSEYKYSTCPEDISPQFQYDS